MAGAELVSNLFFFGALLLLCLALFFYWLSLRRGPVVLIRHEGNPVLSPNADHWWESQAVFNPARSSTTAACIFFIARWGPTAYRASAMRQVPTVSILSGFPIPFLRVRTAREAASHHPYTSPARLTYDTVAHASGGGWGGCEDPRAVKIDGTVYLTFNMFNGWDSMRVALTALDAGNLTRQHWGWQAPWYLLASARAA